MIAILLEEPVGESCEDTMAKAEGLWISAGTLTEAYVVAARRGFLADMVDLVARLKFRVVPIDAAFAAAVGRAYARHGKGLHAASLSFGDGFAYALAKQLGRPLLFVGDDFARTDVASALR